MKQIAYSEYRTIARTFDILNFENKDWLWRIIGHTAMVYKAHNGQLHCWESTSRGLCNQSGVQLNSLKLRLKTCNSRVFVRQINAIDEMVIMKARVRLEHFIENNRGIPYPPTRRWKGIRYLLNAEIDCGKLTENKEDRKMRFCTDLIAATYRDCGLAKFPGASSEFEPDDMRSLTTGVKAKWPKKHFDCYLVDGVALGDEMEIIL